MMEQILKNTINIVIGHMPDETEYQTCVDYIEGTLSDMEQDGKRMSTVDILNVLFDCRKDCFAQCEECGEYFLPTSDEWNSYAHCCRKCKPYADPDMMPGGHDYY